MQGFLLDFTVVVVDTKARLDARLFLLRDSRKFLCNFWLRIGSGLVLLLHSLELSNAPEHCAECAKASGGPGGIVLIVIAPIGLAINFCKGKRLSLHTIEHQIIPINGRAEYGL